MTETIHKWSDIEDDYRNGLVLGNGASIAFHDRFSYRSLSEEARDRRLITPDVQSVFDDLATNDFELVLRVLWHAQRVNQALGIRESRTVEAYESVKKALIEVVRSIHPRFSDIESKLPLASEFMGRFDTVIALNYDVIVYWAMLVGNSTSPNRFKDCWVSGEFQFDWERFRAPYGVNARSTLVFYPHGNIVLGADIFGTERKVVTTERSSLLETVMTKWDTAVIAPVFVSEGTSAQKMAAIRRSPYLTTVLEEVLPELGPTVTIHGSSLGDSDAHLLDALCRGRPERFAVGVDPSSAELPELCGRVVSRLEARLGRGRFELVFYDRASSGCWIAT